MNDQLPGPCIVKRPLVANLHGPRIFAAGDEIADVPAYLLAKKPIADLIAAAYTAFDKAGRELGVDAVELARSLDIAALIRERDQAREALQACQVFITPLARRQNWDEYKGDAADRIRAIIGTAH